LGCGRLALAGTREGARQHEARLVQVASMATAD